MWLKYVIYIVVIYIVYYNFVLIYIKKGNYFKYLIVIYLKVYLIFIVKL